MKLIDDWRGAGRLWSVRLGAVAWGLLIVMQSWPESALYVWSLLPDETRALLPPRFAMIFPILLGAASMLARIVKQKPKGGDDAEPAA